MTFTMVDGLATIQLDALGTLAVALCVLVLGSWLKKRSKFLQRFCIPAPVAGGIVFAVVHCITYMTGVLTFSFDTTFQNPAMLAYFTCVGLSSSVKSLKNIGRAGIVFYVASAALVFIQALIALGLTKVTGLNPMYGMLASNVTMMGGHGNGAAYGQMAAELGFDAAVTVGLACATFGLVAGSLTGGPLAEHLIKHFHLDPEKRDRSFDLRVDENNTVRVARESSTNEIIRTVAVVAVVTTVGVYLAKTVSSLGVNIPQYVGVVILGMILGNVDSRAKLINIDPQLLERTQSVMLSVFLSLAMVTLYLWQLIDLAIPLLIILSAQTLFLLFYARFICFPLMGKDYDSAVSLAGLMGYGLGATPNAVANMNSLGEKYGYSKKAEFNVCCVTLAFQSPISVAGLLFVYNGALKMAGLA